jgi:hypothetical protein
MCLIIFPGSFQLPVLQKLPLVIACRKIYLFNQSPQKSKMIKRHNSITACTYYLVNSNVPINNGQPKYLIQFTQCLYRTYLEANRQTEY